MSYIQTQTDKEDEKLLRKLLSEKMPEKDADKIISHVFSNLIKWTYEDRHQLIEQLWSIVLDDNNRTPEENKLMRVLTHLLGTTNE